RIMVRAQDVDFAPLISGLRAQTPRLTHPELEQVAIEHAAFLTELATRQDLLRRQVLIVLREPRHGATPNCGPTAARGHAGAEQRVLRRADETVRALSAPESPCGPWTAPKPPPCWPPAVIPAHHRRHPRRLRRAPR